MPKQTFFNLNEDKRERVIQAGFQEFAHNDYQKANLDHLVEMSGISKGSLYQYFEDKEDCYVFIAREALERAWQIFQKSLEETVPSDCFDMLYQALFFTHKLREKEPELALIYLRVGFLQDTHLRKKIFPGIHQKNSVFLNRLFSWGIEKGLIDPDLNLEAASFIIDAVSNRFQEKVFLQDNFTVNVSNLNKNEIENFLQNIISLLRKALALQRVRRRKEE